MKPTCCHGVLMEINGLGALLRGPPGCGKSELGLELLRRGHRLVADDIVLVGRRGEVIFGEAPEETRGLIAVRGLGIINVEEMFGHGSVRKSKSIDLVIDHRPTPTRRVMEDFLGHEPLWTTIEAVSIPTLVLTGDPGSGAKPTRTECLVRHFALRTLGARVTTEEVSSSRRGGGRIETCD